MANEQREGATPATNPKQAAVDGIKVSKEMCEVELARFAEAMALDLSEDKLDAEDKLTLAAARDTVIRAMMSRKLVISEDEGEPIFTTSEGVEVRFHEVRGATLMAMDTKKEGQKMAKVFAMLAQQTRKSVAMYSNMRKRDLDVCMAVQALFMA